MTFLNPAILWGLTALAVPIIIHFFNLQRPRQVLFSNVAFVKEVKKTVVRRVRFQQWLLLLLRMLAIAMLVMAFANPVWTGDNQNLIKGNRSVVMVIDNSLSMSAGNDQGDYLKQALNLAQQTILDYSEQDEFLVMPSSELQFNANFLSKEEALEILQNISTDQNTRSHLEILSFLRDIFARSSYSVKELYFFSDFQTSTVMADTQNVANIDSSYIINYVPLADRDQQNAYIAGHEITSQIVEAERPVNMSMQIVNDGNNAISDLNVRVLLEDKVVAIDNEEIGAQATKALDLTFTPSDKGWLSGYIEINDNPIDFDNRRYFSLYVPDQENILIVEGQSSPNFRVLFETLFSQFNAEFLSVRNVSQTSFEQYRSIILLGISDISSGLSDKLSTFLAEGGSMMFFPGNKVNLNDLNDFFQEINVGAWKSAINYQDGINATEVDLDHPVFEGIFSENRKNREFDAPRVFKVHPISLDNQTIHNRIISVNTELPVVIESKVNEGLIYTFTIFPGDDWTDFHVKTIFAPFIFRATQILNQTQQVQSSRLIGSSDPKLIRTSVKDLIYLVDEGNLELIPEQYNQSGGLILSFDKLDIKPGNYQLLQSERLLEKISFNISDEESRLAYTPRAKLNRLLRDANLGNIEILSPEVTTISQNIQSSRQGFPLWKYCILFAVLFLLTEIVVLKVFKRS